MKVRLDLFPQVLISWVAIVYLLLQDNIGWLLWILVAFVILERILVKLMVTIQQMYIQAMAKKAYEELGKQMKQEKEVPNPFSDTSPFEDPFPDA